MSELKPIELASQDMFVLAKLQCAELDEAHASDMQKKTQAAAEESPDLAVVLDMSRVQFIPSLSLGALVTLLQHTKQRQQRFILVGLRPEVRQTFAVCRLDKLFEIYDTVEAAQSRIEQQS
ncbi:MAG: STAS domain-containing protein [Planctomycetota bacterium]|jgi:anti-anti-sigma factor